MATVIPPEVQNKISQWRQKAIAGTLSLEEMREAIIALRMGRRSAVVEAASKSRKGPSKSAEDLLSELDKL